MGYSPRVWSCPDKILLRNASFVVTHQPQLWHWNLFKVVNTWMNSWISRYRDYHCKAWKTSLKQCLRKAFCIVRKHQFKLLLLPKPLWAWSFQCATTIFFFLNWTPADQNLPRMYNFQCDLSVLHVMLTTDQSNQNLYKRIRLIMCDDHVLFKDLVSMAVEKSLVNMWGFCYGWTSGSPD